jgi:hypothetical protein
MRADEWQHCVQVNEGAVIQRGRVRDVSMDHGFTTNPNPNDERLVGRHVSSTRPHCTPDADGRLLSTIATSVGCRYQIGGRTDYPELTGN